MQELIAEQVKNTFSKAIKKFTKKSELEVTDVSILLNLNNIEAYDDENNKVDVRVLCSFVCHNHKIAYETKLQDIMGLTLTLTGIGSLVQAHIHSIIESFEKEYESSVELSVYVDREDEDEVMYFVYANGELKKQFMLLDVLKV
jgi:hypothetical protein